MTTWLHRIAYREYQSWLRSRREHLPLEGAANVPDPSATQELENVLLLDAVNHLPRDQREAVLLYYLQELSVREIAGVLDLPEGTVTSRLYLARNRMRSLLTDCAEKARRKGCLHEVPAIQPKCDTNR